MVNNSQSRGRVRLENDERREKLIELGVRLFGEYSYDELSIERIAELAGISKGLLYHYFKTKRDFYLETLRACGRELLAVTQPPPDADREAALGYALNGYLDYVKANARSYTALIQGGLGMDPEAAAMVNGVRAEIIARMVRREKPPFAAGGRMDLGLRGWLGFVEHATVGWLESRRISQNALVELLAAQLRPLFHSGGKP